MTQTDTINRLASNLQDGIFLFLRGEITREDVVSNIAFLLQNESEVETRLLGLFILDGNAIRKLAAEGFDNGCRVYGGPL